MAEFHQPVTVETVTQIGAMIVQESAARDARPTSPLQPVVTRLDDVVAREVEWLWPGRVALGAVTLLAGDPGLGKSFLTLDMAARVSTGADWPDETRQGDRERGRQGDRERGRQGDSISDPALSLSPCLQVSPSCQPKRDATSSSPMPVSRAPGSVISAEDDPATTIRPRFEALGGAIEQIFTFDAVEGRDESKKYTRPFELGRDMELLADAIEERKNCRLLIVDPVSAFLGRANENANAEVRRILSPLAELAAKYNLAVVLVSHLRKEEGAAMYRALGSVAFVAAARAAWMVVRDPRCRERRLLVPVKNNLAVDVGALAFTIEPIGPSGAPIVCWCLEPVETPADGALFCAESPSSSGRCSARASRHLA
jgi:AAA domain